MVERRGRVSRERVERERCEREIKMLESRLENW